MGISKVCLLALVALMAVAMTQGFFVKKRLQCPTKCGYHAKCVEEKVLKHGGNHGYGYVYEKKLTCKCLGGYIGDGYTCKSTNPCARRPCHKNAYCTPWGYRAICTCQYGFKGNGLYCEKINPCKHNRCHKHAKCIAYGHRYGCKCKSGFHGTGYYCRKYQPTYRYGRW